MNIKLSRITASIKYCKNFSSNIYGKGVSLINTEYISTIIVLFLIFVFTEKRNEKEWKKRKVPLYSIVIAPNVIHFSLLSNAVDFK